MTRSACTNCSSFWSVIWQRTWKNYCALQTSTNIILWLSSKALSLSSLVGQVLSLFDFSFSSLAGQVLLILRLQILVACRASAFHMFDFSLPSPAGQVLFVLRLQFLVASRSSALCSSTLMTMILMCLKRLWWIASQESRVLLCSKDFEAARFLHCW